MDGVDGVKMDVESRFARRVPGCRRPSLSQSEAAMRYDVGGTRWVSFHAFGLRYSVVGASPGPQRCGLCYWQSALR